MAGLVVVVDDEPDILDLVALHLQKAGFSVKKFKDANSFMSFMSLGNIKPDLVILDLMLPDADGIDICKNLKSKDEFASIPIIMLTARTDETDKVLGLEIGADDYITKPFSPRELVARVKAVLRRGSQRLSSKVIEIGDLIKIDTEKFEVFVKGKKIELTSTEFRILRILAENRGKVFSRDKILDLLWGYDKSVISRTVDVHIRNLRKKLGEAAFLVKNVRGMGYKIEE